MTSIAWMFREHAVIPTSSMLRGGMSVQVRLYSVKQVLIAAFHRRRPILLRWQMGVCYRPGQPRWMDESPAQTGQR